jgi:hypothetical protein
VYNREKYGISLSIFLFDVRKKKLNDDDLVLDKKKDEKKKKKRDAVDAVDCPFFAVRFCLIASSNKKHKNLELVFPHLLFFDNL